jgi:hypothetical protein
MPEHLNDSIGPISKLVKFFCPDVEVGEFESDDFHWYLLSDWDTQINKKSDSEKHPWLVGSGATPAGFIRWNRSTTRSGTAPSKLYQRAHPHSGCLINEVGWVQVSEPQVRGAHLLSKFFPCCEEIDVDWLYSFELCRKQIDVNSFGKFSK